MITLLRYLSIGGKYCALALLPAALVTGVLYGLWKLRRRKAGGGPERSFSLLFFTLWYMLTLLLVVFAGRPGANNWANFTAFAAYREAFLDFSAAPVLNIALNIALFLPFGFLFAIPLGKRGRALLVLPLGLGLSCGIEVLQRVLSLGIMDIDDVINNFLGVLMGYSLYALLKRKRDGKKLWTSWRSAVYLLFLLLPGFVFGGTYGAYMLQDYGNLPYTYDCGSRLDIAEVRFADGAENELVSAAGVYRIASGTREDAFAFAEGFFAGMGSEIGEHVEFYDDCAVLYNAEHKVCLWYFYDTATYRLGDFYRDLPEHPAAEADEVRAALAEWGIALPERAVFVGRNPEDERQLQFRVDPELQPETIGGTLQCTYYMGKAHNIENELMRLSLEETLALPSKEELIRRLQKGDFYFDQPVSPPDGPVSLLVTGLELIYEIDTKGYYRPVYRLDLQVSGEEVPAYLVP